MSGFDRARATRRAKELGVDLVISKPFDLQDFLNAVRGLSSAEARQTRASASALTCLPSI